MRIAAISGAICLSLVGLSIADGAKAAADRIHTSIPPEALGTALKEFAQVRDMQVLYFSAAVKDLRTGGVSGELTADETLSRLLSGTGLTYRYVGSNAVTILPAIGRLKSASPADRQTNNTPAPPTPGFAGKEGKSDSSRRFRMAHVDREGTAATATVSEGEQPGPGFSETTPLEEVVVTAEKRAERLEDVPVPVTAIDAASLVENNQVRIQDYALTVPGLTVSGENGFYENLSIRGITTGTANPTVSIMIDDVPFGSASIDGGGLFVPDFDPGDLARVEVLRGPQGTLYGASSMGGLLKFVTIDPATNGFRGRLTAGTSSVDNGAKLGYTARGSLNVPLSGTLAVRLSGFMREDPGFIDNPVLHRRGVNETKANGGHISALWRPSAAFSLKLSALYQDVRIGGDNNIEIPPLDAAYDQSEVPGAGASDMTVQAYGATAKVRFGSADLTVISGYTINSSRYSQDYSAVIPSGPPQFPLSGGTRLDLDMRNGKFTQELRLAMPLGTTVDWLLGGFYSHESTTYGQSLYAENSSTGQIAGEWVFFNVPQTYTEYAGFTDLTFHVTDRFDVQAGARDSDIKQSSSETQVGAPYAALIGSGNPLIYPTIQSSTNALTYLLTPRWKFSRDWMAYVRLASGYRPGGPNVAPGVPRQYQPDKTQSYELGLKGDALQHRIGFDASLYYIDWRNIQLTLLDPRNYQGYTANASRAKSQGIELSVSAGPVDGLTASAWVAWNTAVLKQGFPYNGILYEAYGASGDRLPFGSRFSGNVTVTEEFRLSDNLSSSVGIVESYVGNQIGGFQSVVAPGVVPTRQFYPPYARTDFRAGIEYAAWSVNLFANNVLNRKAIIPLGGLDASPLPANYFTVLQPRLIGLNVTRTF